MMHGQTNIKFSGNVHPVLPTSVL